MGMAICSATVTFTSGPGNSGWQTATLGTPVQVLPNTEYVASFRTEDNYLAASNFFDSDYVDPFGKLSAPGGANGVYAYSSAVVFPTQSYLSSNYWADLSFEPVPLVNTAPVFTSSSGFSVSENSTQVGQLTASDGENDPLVFALAGGPDAALFEVDATSGNLRFLTPPDFETPADQGGDNVYDVTVSVSDNIAPAVEQSIQVEVVDVVDETPSNVSTLFDDGVSPNIATSDPTDYELGVKFQPSENGVITGLRYYRGAADSTDTDVRTLNLWTGDGLLLASATVELGTGRNRMAVRGTRSTCRRRGHCDLRRVVRHDTKLRLHL